MNTSRRQELCCLICEKIEEGGIAGYAAMFYFGHGIDTGVFDDTRRPPGAHAMSRPKHFVSVVGSSEDEMKLFKHDRTDEERTDIFESVGRWLEKVGRERQVLQPVGLTTSPASVATQ